MFHGQSKLSDPVYPQWGRELDTIPIHDGCRNCRVTRKGPEWVTPIQGGAGESEQQVSLEHPVMTTCIRVALHTRDDELRLHAEAGGQGCQCVDISNVVWEKEMRDTLPPEDTWITHCDPATSLKLLTRPPWEKTEQIGHQGLKTGVTSSLSKDLNLS